MKKRIIGILIIISIASLYILISVSDDYKLYVYNTEEKTVILKNNNEVILQNVHAPIISDSAHILALFLEEEPYIGIYDIESKEKHILFLVEKLGEYLGENICMEEIKNIQMIPSDECKVSFIYQQELYRYNTDGTFEKIWNFAGECAGNPYKWIDESQLLIMDEMGILNEWTLYLYNVDSSTKKEIEKMYRPFIIPKESSSTEKNIMREHGVNGMFAL